MPTAPRLVAVGDVHGELERFHDILRAEQLIDADNDWIARDTILLQMGDVIDRGPYSLESFQFIRDLQKKAPEKGSHVVRLFGNHELLVLQGIYFYCNFSNLKRLRQELRNEIIEGKIQAAFTWKGRLYTHAGLRLGILKRISDELGIATDHWEPYYEKIAEYLNQLTRKRVKEDNFKHPIFWVDSSRGGINEVGGIFWSHYPDLESEWLNPIRQVVGHSPLHKKTRKGIRWTKDGNKINIDVGLYTGYSGNQAWLVVEGNRVIAKNLWKGKLIETVIE